MLQAMIDLEINKGIYGFTRGIEISDETINTNLINKIGFGETENYLSSSQTLQFFKDILWDSELFDTKHRKINSISLMIWTDNYCIKLTKS